MIEVRVGCNALRKRTAVSSCAHARRMFAPTVAKRDAVTSVAAVATTAAAAAPLVWQPHHVGALAPKKLWRLIMGSACERASIQHLMSK